MREFTNTVLNIVDARQMNNQICIVIRLLLLLAYFSILLLFVLTFVLIALVARTVRKQHTIQFIVISTDEVSKLHVR